MTKLIFCYSWVYDQSIYSWLGKEWKDKYIKEGRKYAREIQKWWNRINDKVFVALRAFGFKLPSIWRAYPVTCKEITPFSDPLTIKISYDWNHVFTTIIHELAHIAFSLPENKKLKDKTFKYIKKTFPKEKPQTRAHIPIILLQLSVMAKVFPKKYQKMLVKQKSFSSLKRAWKIIEKNKNKIDISKPIESILNLNRG